MAEIYPIALPDGRQCPTCDILAAFCSCPDLLRVRVPIDQTASTLTTAGMDAFARRHAADDIGLCSSCARTTTNFSQSEIAR